MERYMKKNNNKTVETKTNKIDVMLLLMYIYLFMPLFLFCMLWLKPLYAVVACGLIAYGIDLALKEEKPLWKPEKNKNNFALMALILFLIVLVVITSGTGASVTQYPDHLYRNALFRMIIDHDWPVKLTQNGSTKILSYYIGFWLPAGLIAKFTSYQVGFLFLQIWSVIGLVFVFYLIFERKQKIRLWYFIVFIFFGGGDAIGFKLIGKIFDQVGNSYEWWSINYNYPGFMTSLFWVYNQVIYAWLTHLLIMRQKNNHNILFIWSASLLNCTFPSVGMIPFAVYRAITNVKSQYYVDRVKKAILECLTWQFGIGFILALLSTMYLTSNINVIKYMALDNTYNVISTSNYMFLQGDFSAFKWTTRLYNYLWFVFLEFIIHFIIIYKAQSHKPIYWLTLVVLFICPLIEIGGWIDFCMRGSIPALLTLYLMVIDSLEIYYKENNKVLFTILVVYLVICAITCYETLLGVMKPMANNIWDSVQVMPEAFSEDYVFNANNFFADASAFFFRVFAK